MDELKTNSIDLNYRKTIARTLLSNNQLNEAIPAYAAIVKDYPLDTEAFIILGDLYLAGEDSTAALYFYHRAKLIAPENSEITNRIELAESEKNNSSTQANLLPLGAERLNGLQEKLSGKSRGIQEKEIEKAAKLLEEIIQSSHPAELVANHLDQIDSLLPALLEMNIRQAKADRRTDLVEGLESIQSDFDNKQTSSSAPGQNGIREEPLKVTDATILVADQESSASRARFIQECLTGLGIQVELTDSLEQARLTKPQLVIASNPHMNPWLMEYIAECTASRIPVILDLDADYEQMPMNHPEYLGKGLGLPVNARAYTAALMLSNLVTTPSLRFSEQLTRSGYNSVYLPDGWSKSNPLWEKKQSRRNTINIGWVGGTGQLEDLVEIRRILIRVVREFPRTQLVISEDQKAFQLFENLPENRKMFLPEVSAEDYPFVWGSWIFW